MSPRVSKKRYELGRPLRRCLRENAEGVWGRRREVLELKEKIEEVLRQQERPHLYLSGRRIGSLQSLHFELSCFPSHLGLSFRLSSKGVRRRVVEMAQDSFGALVLKTEWLGKPEVIEIRPVLPSDFSRSPKELRVEFQKSVEKLIAANFPKTLIEYSAIRSDLEDSISGKYVRLRFRSGCSEWNALAVSPWEDQATTDAILSNALIWRELQRTESLRSVNRLLLIVPSHKLLVLKSRLAWVHGAARQIHLMSMEIERNSLSFVDLADCGNLDTALSQVQHLRNAQPRDDRSGGNLNCERRLESLIMRDVKVVDANLDQRFVYPQVPAFLSGDRGVIDLLAMTNHGRLAVIELKVGEDIELPMQGLDYWLRVRWHHLRKEFQNKGYFPGVELSELAPLLYFVCPQFRYHSSFPQIVGQLDSSVPLIQVGINEHWSRGIQVVLRRKLSSAGDGSAEFLRPKVGRDFLVTI